MSSLLTAPALAASTATPRHLHRRTTRCPTRRAALPERARRRIGPDRNRGRPTAEPLQSALFGDRPDHRRRDPGRSASRLARYARRCPEHKLASAGRTPTGPPQPRRRRAPPIASRASPRRPPPTAPGAPREATAGEPDATARQQRPQASPPRAPPPRQAPRSQAPRLQAPPTPQLQLPRAPTPTPRTTRAVPHQPQGRPPTRSHPRPPLPKEFRL